MRANVGKFDLRQQGAHCLNKTVTQSRIASNRMLPNGALHVMILARTNGCA